MNKYNLCPRPFKMWHIENTEVQKNRSTGPMALPNDWVSSSVYKLNVPRINFFYKVKKKGNCESKVTSNL